MSDPAPAAVNPTAVAMLDGLTPEQQAAVCHGYGPLLVFAGPGAGKTNTLTRRIGWLRAHGVPAHEILAVTFTVAAAGEMRLRLIQLLGEEAVRGLTVATFHSICARILREHASLFGRTGEYTIYDQAEIKKVIDHVLSDAERTAIQHQLATYGQAPAKEVLTQISLAKNRLWTPDILEAHSSHPLGPLIAAVWREVDEELRHSNAFDFDDLLLCAVRLLADHPAIGQQHSARWPWLLVDEFQDTNYAQMALVQLLAGPNGNVTVVGDDDQVLYRFRGAEPDNILRFGQAFPSAVSVTLGRNFRSHREIVEVSSRAIAHNRTRVPKELIAHRGDGGFVGCYGFRNDHEEAEWMTRQIANALAAGISSREIMVIARTAYATTRLQQSLAAHNIPHRVLGSLGLYERKEVKDAVAYLALLANPCDAQAFRRAVSTPRRGVGAATANRLIAAARDRDGDLIAACAGDVAIRGLPRPTRAALAQFAAQLQAIRGDLQAGRSIGHIVSSTLMMDGGIVGHFEGIVDSDTATNEERRDAERVLEDLRTLASAAADYHDTEGDSASLVGFLEHAALTHAQELDGEDERITISTIHRSKGTEAELVFVLGCEEGLLPSWRVLQDGDEHGLEEERRLFYVAATRAKNRLIFTAVANRNDRATDGGSRFLAEAGLQRA